MLMDLAQWRAGAVTIEMGFAHLKKYAKDISLFAQEAYNATLSSSWKAVGSALECHCRHRWPLIFPSAAPA